MTIFGVDVGRCGAGMPDERQQSATRGISWSGETKFHRYQQSIRPLAMVLRRKSTAIKNALIVALEGAADSIGAISPDADQDLGAGVGAPIMAFWNDDIYKATPVRPDAWDIPLNFLYLEPLD